MNKHLKTLLPALAGLLAAGAGVWAAVSWLPPAAPAVETRVATVLPGGRDIAAFELRDHTGAVFASERLRERWSLLFFGFTHCPDVCPQTLLTLADAVARIEAAGVAAPQVVFVSVDPERDTPARLAEYANYFNPEFVGITGEHAELQKLTRDLGLLYVSQRQGEDDQDYQVDHSAALVLVNPAGRMQALFQAPHRPDAIADDYLNIHRRYRN